MAAVYVVLLVLLLFEAIHVGAALTRIASCIEKQNAHYGVGAPEPAEKPDRIEVS